jgi:alkanesulfonate monooxygenase SsuD/methylene tetrahydromethanopterin reductase-like flavin-dependent oxidoreductase (luciferase family)
MPSLWVFPSETSRALVAALTELDNADTEIWIGDEGPRRDPFSLATAVLAATSQLRLGIGVTNVMTRHPMALATAAMTTAELSDDRFLLGVGAGGSLSLDPVGLGADRPVTRAIAGIELIRAICAGETTAGYAPPADALSHPVPLWVGSKGERFNRWASAHADGVLLAGVSRGAVDRTLGWARSVRPIAATWCLTAAFDEESVERLRVGAVVGLRNGPADDRCGLSEHDLDRAVEAHHLGDDRLARTMVTDDVLATLAVWGTPADVAHEVHRQAAQLRRRHGDDLTTGIAVAGSLLAHWDSVTDTLTRLHGSSPPG